MQPATREVGTAVDGLVAERVGPHVLLLDAADASRERAFLERLDESPGELFVLLVRGASARPGLAEDLLAVLAPLLADPDPSTTTVRVGVDDLAPHGDLVAALTAAGGPELVAPEGGLAFGSGPSVYVGPTGGGTGWWRFPAGGRAVAAGTRFPAPVWEPDLPDTAIEVGGAVAEPVPAGMVVRARDAAGVSPVDLAFHVVVDPGHPQLVVSTPTPPVDAVAAVLTALLDAAPARGDEAARPPAPVLLAPLGPVDPAWFVELAGLAGPAAAPERAARLLVAPGTRLADPAGGVRSVALDDARHELFAPFATVLRPTGDGHLDVVDVAAPPPGWEPAGPRAYRPVPSGAPGTAVSAAVTAEVVADGLVLSTRAADEPADRLPDPAGWVLELGRAGETVDAELLAAARGLLEVLDERRRERVEVRLVGRWDGSDRAGLAELLPPDRLPGEHTVPASAVSEPAAPVADPPVRVEPAFATPPPVPVAPPPVGTVSRSPMRTVDPAPVPSAAPAGGGGPGEVGGEAPGAGPQGPTAGSGADGTAEVAAAFDVVSRPSVATEQTRFAAAAGESFTEALATVNAAMATWPSLRAQEGTGAKADLVAVCLHLEEGVEGDAGAARLNAAVRGGREGVLDGQLPCLVSGLRRLPTHRRPVLRQGVDEPVPAPDAAPRWFVEPGFLSASTDLDVTVPGASFDVLILPSSARRTAELTAVRPVDEAVFPAGARFKALAVRGHDAGGAPTGPDPSPPDADPVAPRVALLVRELAPDEAPECATAPHAEGSDPEGPDAAGSDAAAHDPDGALDERDRAALTRLDRALAGRRGATLRLVEDPPTVGRLTAPMPEVRVEALARRPGPAPVGPVRPVVAAGS